MSFPSFHSIAQAFSRITPQKLVTQAREHISSDIKFMELTKHNIDRTFNLKQDSFSQPNTPVYDEESSHRLLREYSNILPWRRFMVGTGTAFALQVTPLSKDLRLISGLSSLLYAAGGFMRKERLEQVVAQGPDLKVKLPRIKMITGLPTYTTTNNIKLANALHQNAADIKHLTFPDAANHAPIVEGRPVPIHFMEASVPTDSLASVNTKTPSSQALQQQTQAFLQGGGHPVIPRVTTASHTFDVEQLRLPHASINPTHPPEA
jgi:hypothetical protein